MTSRDPKGQVVTPITLRIKYGENSWRCYLTTTAKTTAVSV